MFGALFSILAAFVSGFLFDTVCGWIGHIVVKAVTLGKVDLDWGPTALESNLTSHIGFFTLLIAAGGVAAVLD